MTGSDPASGRIAVLDACSLVPIRLTTALLWLAEAGVFEVLWSDAILDEVRRNLPKLGVSEQRADRRVAAMREAFGVAALVNEYEYLIPEMTCDAKDRHVLAAAVHGGANTLVTFNLKDFPATSTAGHDVDVVHPDMFLTRLLAEHSDDVIAALHRGTADLHNPTQTVTEFLASMTATVPIFANLAADVATSPLAAEPPVAALIGADEDEAIAAFGETGDLSNPAQVALGWWTGIISSLDLARALTYDPKAWGNYQWAIDLLADKSLASKVLPAVDAPGRLAFMRFVPEVASAAQVFSSYMTTATFLTLIRIADGTWRVWGLGAGIPAAKDVLGDPDFVPGGGTGLVIDWLTRIAEPDPPVEVIWGGLDAPLRLANAQSWLLATGHATSRTAHGSSRRTPDECLCRGGPRPKRSCPGSSSTATDPASDDRNPPERSVIRQWRPVSTAQRLLIWLLLAVRHPVLVVPYRGSLFSAEAAFGRGGCGCRQGGLVNV